MHIQLLSCVSLEDAVSLVHHPQTDQIVQLLQLNSLLSPQVIDVLVHFVVSTVSSASSPYIPILGTFICDMLIFNGAL